MTITAICLSSSSVYAQCSYYSPRFTEGTYFDPNDSEWSAPDGYVLMPVIFPAYPANSSASGGFRKATAQLRIEQDPSTLSVDVERAPDTLIVTFWQGAVPLDTQFVTLSALKRTANIAVNLPNDSTLATDTFAFHIQRPASLADNHDLLQIESHAYVEYNIEVGDVLVNISSMIDYPADDDAESKRKLLNWSKSSEEMLVCGWQVQLLKLTNDTLGMPPQGDSRIYAGVEWDNATTILSEQPVCSLVVALAEGTGFYVWRVRATSLAANGEIRYGKWSHTVSRHGQYFAAGDSSKDSSGRDYKFFYFGDPDSTRNYTYERIFTEKDAVKERAKYADGLNNLRQTITTLPADGKTIVEQNVLDYSGRPALKLLPVPLSDGPKIIFRRMFAAITEVSGSFPSLVFTDKRPYRPRDFDTDAKLLNFEWMPKPDLLYFSTYPEHVNKGVSGTDGIPFSRTFYTNDNTNRVSQESLPTQPLSVKTFGDQPHTTRYIYAAASDSELVKLFGAEAPDPENVEKTITIDPNNTATATFKTRDGKVLATVLILNNDDSLTLDPMPGTGSDSSAGYLGTGVAGASGITTSKALYLPASTWFSINYHTGCNSVTQGCLDVSLNCRYLLDVSITKTDGSDFKHFSLPTDVTQTAWHIAEGDSARIIAHSDTIACQTEATVDFRSLRLPMGSYSIEKRIIPIGDGDIVSAAGNAMGNQTAPLVNLLTVWLGKIKSPCGLKDFKDSVTNLNQRLYNARHSADSISAFGKLDTLYRVDSLDMYSYFTGMNKTYFQFVKSLGVTANEVLVSTQCCRDFVFPLANFSAFNGDPKIYARHDTAMWVNPYVLKDCDAVLDFTFDYEGIAYNYFWDCVSDTDEAYSAYPMPAHTVAKPADTNKIKTIYYTYLDSMMIGYQTPGTFNMMVYKMLTETYGKDTSGTIESPYQYTPNKLYRCWLNQLSFVRQRKGGCPNGSVGLPDSSYTGSISSSVDRENGNSGAVHDDLINSNIHMNWFMRWIAGRKIRKASQRVRDAQLPPGASGGDSADFPSPIDRTFHYNMVVEFLNCTGYRFAKIITDQDIFPISTDSIAGSTLYSSPLLWTYSGTPTAISPPVSSDTNKQGYRPMPAYQVSYKPAGTSRYTQYLSGVKDPVYAFKYYQYKVKSQAEIELQNCFSDPNFYTDGTGKHAICPGGDSICDYCSIGRIKCGITHKKWSSGQRYAYFKVLQGALNGDSPDIHYGDSLNANDFESPGYYNHGRFLLWENEEDSISNYSDFVSHGCRTNMFTIDSVRMRSKVEIDISTLNRAVSYFCESKRLSIRTSLLEALHAKGFHVDSCVGTSNPNNILARELGYMVDQVVTECKMRGQVRTYSIVTQTCRDARTPETITGNKDPEGRDITYKAPRYGTADMFFSGLVESRFKFLQIGGGGYDSVATDTLRAEVYKPGEDELMLMPIYRVSYNPLNSVKDCEATRRLQVMSMQMGLTAGTDSASACSGLIPTDTMDCPTCITNLPGSAPNVGGQAQPPTADTHVRLDVTLDRKGVINTKRFYQAR
ncbi:MAG: hypothetical protein V4543_09680 [Bacteroidota bacterium]